MAFHFKHPFTCIVCGPTQSGKTYFVSKMVEHAKEVILPTPTRILWYGGGQQPMAGEMETLISAGVEVKDGLDNLQLDLAALPGTSSSSSSSSSETREATLIIIDDLMTEAGRAQEVCDLFTRGSHHGNISIVLIMQNLFHQSRCMRTISLNSQYIVLLKNPRDAAQVRYLGQQLFPGRRRLEFFVDAYKQATLRPHGYLLVDLTQTTLDEKRILSDILPQESTCGGYYFVPKRS